MEISSLPKEIKKILVKIFKGSKEGLKELDFSILGRYLRNIYDQEYVSKMTINLRSMNKDALSFEEGCELLQVFIVSDCERDFVLKIKKKLYENEELDEQIENVKGDLENGIHKKYRLGHQQGQIEKKMNFEVKIYENKLEKANQKLNLSITENTELRKKINLMRKEKNIIQKIYE